MSAYRIIIVLKVLLFTSQWERLKLETIDFFLNMDIYNDTNSINDKGIISLYIYQNGR